jgi:hypothetical protein
LAFDVARRSGGLAGSVVTLSFSPETKGKVMVPGLEMARGLPFAVMPGKLGVTARPDAQ